MRHSFTGPQNRTAKRYFWPGTRASDQCPIKGSFLETPWIEPAKPTGDKLAQIRKCRRSQDEGVITKPDPDSADVDLSQREHLNPIEWGKPAPLRPVPH